MKQLLGKHIGGCNNFDGYKVICNFNNERVLAYSRISPEPWVVWRVDRDGDMYWGKYFSDPVEARRYFIQSVSDTRTTPKEINNINDLKTETLENYLTLHYNSNPSDYDIVSKEAFDFTDNPQHAWNAYLRELKTITIKQIFEILNLEKMRNES